MKFSSLTTSYVADAAPARSGLAQAISGLVNSLRKASADRALHRQLSDMDDSLLRDIGLGEDEIYRVRQGASITPRNWR